MVIENKIWHLLTDELQLYENELGDYCIKNKLLFES